MQLYVLNIKYESEYYVITDMDIKYPYIEVNIALLTSS